MSLRNISWGGNPIWLKSGKEVVCILNRLYSKQREVLKLLPFVPVAVVAICWANLHLVYMKRGLMHLYLCTLTAVWIEYSTVGFVPCCCSAFFFMSMCLHIYKMHSFCFVNWPFVLGRSLYLWRITFCSSVTF